MLRIIECQDDSNQLWHIYALEASKIFAFPGSLSGGLELIVPTFTRFFLAQCIGKGRADGVAV